MQDDLIALTERCEAAEGPDRELDAAIRCAVFAPKDAFVKLSPFNGEWCIYEIGYGGKERSWEGRGVSSLQRSGSFTASIDAAMTLVPEGWDWNTWSTGYARAIHPHSHKRDKEGRARTPALALCAAALRARATMGGGDD